MSYGHFDDKRREYVITKPDTPLPWINYLGCEAYFGIISNTAGGYSFFRDARLRRLTSTAITTSHLILEAGTSICATTQAENSGRHRGNRHSTKQKIIAAGTD